MFPKTKRVWILLVGPSIAIWLIALGFQVKLGMWITGLSMLPLLLPKVWYFTLERIREVSRAIKDPGE